MFVIRERLYAYTVYFSVTVYELSITFSRPLFCVFWPLLSLLNSVMSVIYVWIIKLRPLLFVCVLKVFWM